MCVFAYIHSYTDTHNELLDMQRGRKIINRNRHRNDRYQLAKTLKYLKHG